MEKNINTNISNKKYNVKNIIETFDGIRKDNSRIIFGFLLTIIIIDIAIECLIT
jgi:hypothetical protein